MKLIYCQWCHDLFNLGRKIKKCSCGESQGRYVDNLNAEISGPCTPLGIDNRSFLNSLSRTTAAYNNFTAFVITPDCKTVTRVKNSKISPYLHCQGNNND